MVGSQDVIPIQQGWGLHYCSPIATRHGQNPRRSRGTLPDAEPAAHHEMEWFFATTEGVVRRTSIMVGKNAYPSGWTLKISYLLLESWIMERYGCRMG
jgi:hypothetical protein